MNAQRFKNLWKYHYKKYLALFFTILALICLIGAGAYDVYLSYGQGGKPNVVSDFLSIYDFALFAIAYMLILIGNLQGTTLAYQGMLMYVFMTDTRHSVIRVFKDANPMLWLSFFLGMGLQFFVIEVPGVNSFFKVYPLSDDPIDYLWVFLLAMTPLLVHEISVFFQWIIKKAKV